MINERRCCRSVPDSGRRFGTRPCSRPAIVEEDGDKLCAVHCAAGVAARQARTAARDERKAVSAMSRLGEQERARARAALCLSACLGLTDADLKALGEGGVKRVLDNTKGAK